MDGWKARRCFLLLAVLPGSEWLGHGGVFIAWEASSLVAQVGEPRGGRRGDGAVGVWDGEKDTG